MIPWTSPHVQTKKSVLEGWQASPAIMLLLAFTNQPIYLPTFLPFLRMICFISNINLSFDILFNYFYTILARAIVKRPNSAMALT